MRQRSIGSVSIFIITLFAFWIGHDATRCAHAQQVRGKFVGDVVVKFLPDGRNVKVTKQFSFVDPRGRRWVVPAGAESDGASVPQAFWILYPPFTGQYRAAALVHDVYCQTQQRPWEETHNAFYEATVSAGVDERTAKLLWAAVYYFGPRWGIGQSTRGPGASDGTTAEQEIKIIRGLEKILDQNDISREQLKTIMDRGQLPKS